MRWARRNWEKTRRVQRPSLENEYFCYHSEEDKINLRKGL
jgi:ribosomal protein L28